MWITGTPSGGVVSRHDPTPAAWEKFKIEFTGGITDRMFQLKSSSGKYLRCMGDGSFRADTDGPGTDENFIFYSTAPNELIFFNPKYNKYVKLNDDASIDCKEENWELATKWTSPTYA